MYLPEVFWSWKVPSLGFTVCSCLQDHFLIWPEPYKSGVTKTFSGNVHETFMCIDSWGCLGCDALWFGRVAPTFQRSLLPFPSGFTFSYIILIIQIRTSYLHGGFKTFAVFRMQSVFFWEFPRRLKFKSLIAQDDGTDIEFRNVGF